MTRRSTLSDYKLGSSKVLWDIREGASSLFGQAVGKVYWSNTEEVSNLISGSEAAGAGRQGQIEHQQKAQPVRYLPITNMAN